MTNLFSTDGVTPSPWARPTAAPGEPGSEPIPPWRVAGPPAPAPTPPAPTPHGIDPPVTEPPAPGLPEPSTPAPGGGRAGAIWVTGTGAFLLVAAAAVFVAVRWDRLSDEVKFAILAALTGSCLLAGRALRRLLPATSDVIFHLGAFLIPVNVAAIGIHLEAEWPVLLFAEGVIATAAWWTLGRIDGSLVLRWATGTATVVAAAGAGAVTGWSGALILAVLAVAADARRLHKAAIGWAVIAGLAPSVSFLPDALPDGSLAADIVGQLGLAGATSQAVAIASGLLAAAVLGHNAHLRKDLVLAALSFGVGALGVATAWTTVDAGAGTHLVAGAALFVLAEVVVHLVTAREDPFWSAPARFVGDLAEVAAALATCCAAFVAAGEIAAQWWPAAVGDLLGVGLAPDRGAIVAGGLGLFGWIVADLRRRAEDGSGLAIGLLVGSGWSPAAIFGPMALLSGLAIGTASLTVMGIAALALAGLLILSGRPLGHGVSVALVLSAVVLIGNDHDLGVLPANLGAYAAGIVGGLLLAAAAVVRAHMRTTDDDLYAWLLGSLAAVPLFTAWALCHDRIDPFAGTLAVLGGLVLITMVLDLAIPDVPLLGAAGRVAMLAVLVPALELPLAQIAIVAGAIVVLLGLDAVRLREPWPLYGQAVALPAFVVALVKHEHLSDPEAGIALCLLASVAAGLHLLAPKAWRGPAAAVMVVGAVLGLQMASADLATLSTALVILGAVGLAYAVVERSVPIALLAGLALSAGVWGHLADQGVTALDAYVAPVAIGLAIAGWRARSDGDVAGRPAVSSWVAYGPSIALLGGSALIERIDGNSGWHALVAGSVGVLAVLAGGARRLVGPLLLGTALLIAVTVHESLGRVDVPSWGWLALGGAILVGAGVAMERFDTGPLETSRRLVDVVQDNFS